jgi:hypothetical protein
MVKRPHKASDGYYHIGSKKYKLLFGSREQVWNGTAYKTKGELKKEDFIKNKWNRIVSVKKHKTAKKEKRLEKYGYFAEKGKFGYVKKSPKKTSKKTKKRKGGEEGDGTTPEMSETPEMPETPETTNDDYEDEYQDE